MRSLVYFGVLSIGGMISTFSGFDSKFGNIRIFSCTDDLCILRSIEMCRHHLVVYCRSEQERDGTSGAVSAPAQFQGPQDNLSTPRAAFFNTTLHSPPRPHCPPFHDFTLRPRTLVSLSSPRDSPEYAAKNGKCLRLQFK